MEHDNFLFFELQGLTVGKPFPGFAPGTFIDMMGREIELKADDLKDFITNTLAKIQEFKARNMPGLPIDARKHDKGDAAGWITGAELGEVLDSKGTAVPVIRILAEWTKLGTELIRDKIQTNFSPTVDLEGKAIVGGSLTNWPASVDENGVPLFTAVELSQGIHYLQPADKPKWYDRLLADLQSFINRAENPTPPDNNLIGDEPMTTVTQEQPVMATPAELENPSGDNGQMVDLAQLAEALNLSTVNVDNVTQLAELVTEQVNLQWQRKLSDMQRENKFAELAQRVTGGTAAAPRGIPIEADDLKAELMKLEPEQAKFWAGVLETTVKNGLNDFSEVGHGKQVTQKHEVPEHAVRMLKVAIKNGADLGQFFDAAGLGNVDDYDLSKYIEENE
jgi:hypothetical protein